MTQTRTPATTIALPERLLSRGKKYSVVPGMMLGRLGFRRSFAEDLEIALIREESVVGVGAQELFDRAAFDQRDSPMPHLAADEVGFEAVVPSLLRLAGGGFLFLEHRAEGRTRRRQKATK